MLFPSSYLRIIDNSGGKYLKIIRIIHKGTYGKVGNIGDIFLASIKKLRNKNKLLSKVKKGDLVYAVILKTKNKKTRKNGLVLHFFDNVAVLVNKQYIPLATRIFTTVPQELRLKKFSKLISIANGFI